MKSNNFKFEEVVLGKEGLLKGPFGSDLKKSLFVPKGKNTYKVYLQENILQSDLNNGEHYISEEYYESNMKRYTVKENDFIVTCDGTLGEILQLKNIKEPGIISSSLLRITLDPSIIDADYFFYYFKIRMKNALIRQGNNSVLKHLPGLKVLKEFNLELPSSTTEQKQLASILKLLDSKIELNNRINTELEAMAKTLYDYWFVQLDFPDKNGKPYKTSGGKMVWNEELKREIPEGWDSIMIENCLFKESSIKKIPTAEILEKGKFPVIDQSTDFIAGFTNDKEAIIKTDEPRIIFGDHTRILKLINFDFARGADGTQVMLSNNKRMPQHLFFNTLVKIDLSNYGYARHYKFLKDISIILPDETVSKNFETAVSPFYKMIRENIFQNQKLTELRDWLLPMLMNGQVKVGEAEEIVRMAAEPGVAYGE
jgi:type I restriction enzyme S subunit